MHPHGPSGTNRCTTQIGAGQAAINTSKRNGFEMPTTVVPNIVVSNSAPAARHPDPLHESRENLRWHIRRLASSRPCDCSESRPTLKMTTIRAWLRVSVLPPPYLPLSKESDHGFIEV